MIDSKVYEVKFQRDAEGVFLVFPDGIELPGDEAVIYMDGNRLIIAPVRDTGPDEKSLQG